MSLDPTVTVVAGVLTQLGAAWFVVGCGAVLFAVAPAAVPAPRRVGLLLVALALAAFGAVGALKPLLAIPRPSGAASAALPGTVPAAIAPGVEWAVTGRGFSFPSGHAAVATAGYGGLALLLHRDSTVNRVAEATAIVVTVAGTRLLLGVHRLSDVVAGVGAGLAVLGLVLAVAGTGPAVAPRSVDPRRALGVGTGLLVLALAVSLGTGYAHGVRTTLLALGVTGLALVGVYRLQAADTTAPD